MDAIALQLHLERSGESGRFRISIKKESQLTNFLNNKKGNFLFLIVNRQTQERTQTTQKHTRAHKSTQKTHKSTQKHTSHTTFQQTTNYDRIVRDAHACGARFHSRLCLPKGFFLKERLVSKIHTYTCLRT